MARVNINIKKAKVTAESYYKKDLGLADVDAKIDEKHAFVYANDVNVYGYDVGILGVGIYASGYFSMAMDFETDLTEPPEDLLLALNKFNSEGMGMKAYFEDGCVTVEYENINVNDNALFDCNLQDAGELLLYDDDTKELLEPMFKYFKKV